MKEEPHETKEGYCCACNHDVALFRERKRGVWKTAWNEALDALEEKMPPEVTEDYDKQYLWNDYRSQLLTILKSLRK